MSVSLPPDRPFHSQLPPEKWEAIFQQASMDLRTNHNDPEALQALKDSSEALNAYDQEGVDQSSMAGVGSDLKQVGSGMWDALANMPKAIGSTLHDVRGGQFTKAAKDIGSGLMATGKGVVAPWELAMRELGGETVPSNERNEMLHQSGASLTGLEAMALPGQIGRGASALRGGKGGTGGAPAARPMVPDPDITEPPPALNLAEHARRTQIKSDALNDDPYGLNDTHKPGPAADNMRTELNTMDAAPHDILWDSERGGVKPLTPEQINQLLDDVMGKNMSTPEKGFVSGRDTGPIRKPQLDESEYQAGLKKIKADKGTHGSADDPIDNMLDDNTGSSNTVQDMLSMVPGSMGRMARLSKMLTSMPDATSVRNKALTTALNGAILSGQKPPADSTRTR